MERSFIFAILAVLVVVVAAQFFQPTGDAVRTYDFCGSIRSKTQCETQSTCTWTGGNTLIGDFCIGHTDSRTARINALMTQLEYHASAVTRISSQIRTLLNQ